MGGAVLLAAVAFAAAPAIAAPEEPHGIYVVRGSADQLEKFHAEIGKAWRGGEFLDRLSSKTEFRYWAYPTRTAREARTFIFGSMQHGLQLDIKEYDEAAHYPKERGLLRQVASRCKIASDTFEILPNGKLRLQTGPELRPKQKQCVSDGLKSTDLLIDSSRSSLRGERG